MQHILSSAPLILASASPRRLSLLEQIGIFPTQVIAADLDESVEKSEAPSVYVRRIALEKARKIASEYPNAFVLAADTAVAKGRQILPKAADEQEVLRCMRQLSGCRHTVFTGVAVIAPNGQKSCRHITTRVSFKRLSPAEMEAYAKQGEGVGKAGGYAIQGFAGKFVQWINGSYSAVVGLPLYETSTMLEGLGFSTRSEEKKP